MQILKLDVQQMGLCFIDNYCQKNPAVGVFDFDVFSRVKSKIIVQYNTCACMHTNRLNVKLAHYHAVSLQTLCVFLIS